MKNSTVGIAGLLIALVMLWLAWEGFGYLRWRINYMAPSFIAGAIFGGAVVALLSSGRD